MLSYLAALLLAALSPIDSAPASSAPDLKNRVGDFFSCSYEQTVSHAPATPVNTGENQIHGYETASGIPHYRARYYDPGLGRFISEDPMKFEASDFNLRRFVLNDPRNLNDPYGLNATTEYVFASGGFGAAFEFVDSILEQIEQGEDDIDLVKATIAAGKGAAIGFGTGIFGSFFTGAKLAAIAFRHAGLFTVTGGVIGGTIRFEVWVIGGGPP